MKWIDLEKWTMLPMLDCRSFWFCPNCFSLLIVLVIPSNLQWQWWFDKTEELIGYQLQVNRSKVKVTKSRFIKDQPLQLGSSNLAYLSALFRRGEQMSLPHWYLLISFLDPWLRPEARGQREYSGYSRVSRCPKAIFVL